MRVTKWNKQIYEGWTVGNFINYLDIPLSLIMRNQSWQSPFKTKEELAKWCADNQPHYKKVIPEVVNYFCKLYNIN